MHALPNTGTRFRRDGQSIIVARKTNHPRARDIVLLSCAAFHGIEQRFVAPYYCRHVNYARASGSINRALRRSCVRAEDHRYGLSLRQIQRPRSRVPAIIRCSFVAVVVALRSHWCAPAVADVPRGRGVISNWLRHLSLKEPGRCSTARVVEPILCCASWASRIRSATVRTISLLQDSRLLTPAAPCPSSAINPTQKQKSSGVDMPEPLLPIGCAGNCQAWNAALGRLTQ